VIFVGVDWAEDHHDVCVMDEGGEVLGKRRISDGVEGVADLHALVGMYIDEPGGVVVGIEIDRGLIVTALLGAGYEIYAVNPMAASRYRDRHATSGAKSDPGDAKVLADLVRTDRHNHRQVSGDTELVEGVKIIARAHQSAIWGRQRQVNALRSSLREYYPGALVAFGNELWTPDAVSVLSVAPTPALGRQLSRSKIASALRRGGRTRNVEKKSEEIQVALRADYLEAPSAIAGAHGEVARSALVVIDAYTRQIAALEISLAEHFEQHPDAKVVLSLPGLGTILGARVLGEFGDDRTRYANAKSRKNYGGTSPVTKASGRSRVVLARYARNRRLAATLDRWAAFCSLTHSEGARRYYDELRARGKTHGQANRQLANRWVGILHHCLERKELYSEGIAWRTDSDLAA
jgi:Transposase/Transposase IS116/IS110/IS902 family